MQATRRFWGVAAVGSVLVVLAIVVDRSVLLLGAALIGAWLLARQAHFLGAITAERSHLTVEHTIDRDHAGVEESIGATLGLSRPAAPLAIDATAAPPPAATLSPGPVPRLLLDPGQREARTDYSFSLPIAGQYSLEAPRLEFATGDGLLRERLAIGPGPDLTIEPRSPRTIHVGAAGEQIAAAYGEHPAGRLGSGLDPAELRTYLPGDPADRIDWKATARLAKPYVREFEAETDRRTALLVDHRGPLGAGQPGETALDHLRQVALAFVESARRLDDPLGLYAVGDGGLTAALEPTASPARYGAIRARLHELAPTTPADRSDPSTPVAPALARRRSTILESGSTRFDRTLSPYFAAAEPYVDRIREDPLFASVRRYLADRPGTLWTILLTDDSDRSGVRESVKLARRGDDRVVVYLAPAVLYEPGGLADLERAYDRYVDFEEFRRELDRLPRVSAFEVAPGDRLSSVLAAGRRRRDARVAGGR